METAADSDDDEDVHHVLDFDVGDWVDPEASLLKHGELGKDVPYRGCGSDQMDEESLSVRQADAAIEHTNRVRSLRNAQDIVKKMGGSLGASLNDTLNRVINREQKRFKAMMRSDAEVCQEVFQGLEAE